MLASNQIVNVAFKKNENFLYHIRIILRMIIIKYTECSKTMSRKFVEWLVTPK